MEKMNIVKNFIFLAALMGISITAQAMHKPVLQEKLEKAIVGIGLIPLSEAAALGKIEEVRKLLPTADQESKNDALRWASVQGHADVVRILLRAGANAEAPDELGYTPLIVAETPEVARLLLGAGANPEATVMGKNAAEMARHLGHEETAKAIEQYRPAARA